MNSYYEKNIFHTINAAMELLHESMMTLDELQKHYDECCKDCKELCGTCVHCLAHIYAKKNISDAQECIRKSFDICRMKFYTENK